MSSSLSNYMYNGVGLDKLLARSQPAINVTAVSGSGITTALNLSSSSTFYKANTGYGSIKVGNIGYSYQGTNFSDYLPYYYQYYENAATATISVTGYNKISGFLLGGGGGGGGGGGANRDGDNANGGNGGNGQAGQLVGFEANVSTYNSIYISVGNNGGGGNHGNNEEWNSGNAGNHGGAGNDTSIKINDANGAVLVKALGGGSGNGGGGGTDGADGGNGNTNSTYNTDISIYSSGPNFPRNAGNGGSKGNSGSFPTPGNGNAGSVGSALIFLIKN